MFATIVNCLAIVFGSLLGLVIAGRVKDAYRAVVFDGAGVTTLVIGISMALKSGRVIYLAIALIAGGLVGTLLDIEGAIFRLGLLLERITLRRRAPSKPQVEDATHATWDFGYAFLNSSVLFCVGAMSLVGSFQAGTEGNYTLILTKSVLDGFMAILMTAAMGPGVAFSSLAILLYQGSLTLAAGLLKPYVSEFMLAELTGSGGALVIMIGLNLLGMKKIKTADFLPALVFTVFLVILDPLFLRFGAILGI